jgi:hypothetical protein
MLRGPRIHHCTSEPYRFFGRSGELALLDRGLSEDGASLLALVGPGGQGKTAIVQHWLTLLLERGIRLDGLFLWSFYRGKDADRCLRELLAYAEGLAGPPEVSASYCVEKLLPVLRRERWAIVLDGAEVVQYESGDWAGRFVHPELGRLLEEVATEPMPGVVVLTTRFHLPTLERRPRACLLDLSALDPASSRELLRSVGVQGSDPDLDEVGRVGGWHAKAVELLGTWLRHFHAGQARAVGELPAAPDLPGAAPDELRVAQVLAGFQRDLPAESQDLLALATSFREPAAEDQIRAYLRSEPVRSLLHDSWNRPYTPFLEREPGWLGEQLDELVHLRLLERVGRAGLLGGGMVIDAHPLVRRAFEHVLGPAGRQQGATARAGFLRGRPDRSRPNTLAEAGKEVELFHAFCDAGLWTEADSVLVALENPKHRLLAPVLERDLLLQFFPAGDWRQPPRWPGFGRWRSLAICFELLGQYEEALAVYRPADAPLRGDALLARGELRTLLSVERVGAPWENLWQAYRCHALCLAGQFSRAVHLARSLIPTDIYEWVHVFECLLRAGALNSLDPNTLAAGVRVEGQRWAELACRRMQADLRRHREGPALELGAEYETILEAYDQAGLPWERTLTRLSLACWRQGRGELLPAREVAREALRLARRSGLRVLAIDALTILRAFDEGISAEEIERGRGEIGFHGPPRG